LRFGKDTQSQAGLRDLGDFDEFRRPVHEKHVTVRFSAIVMDLM